MRPPCYRKVSSAGKQTNPSGPRPGQEKGTNVSFRDNLQHLRATRNMTQEQLAMLVGVSRQSVTKWEAERAYPEMDKLIKICDIFECSLDELVSGDLTGRAAASSPSLLSQTSAAMTSTSADTPCAWVRAWASSSSASRSAPCSKG